MTTSLELAERIAELESEVARLKKISRCPHAPRKGLGGIIQRIRQQKGVSMAKLAEKAGISKGWLFKVENTDDSDMGVRMLFTIADALDASVNEIISDLETERKAK